MDNKIKLSPEFSPEMENKTKSRVILEFMRHGKKEKDPDKANEELLLTPEGRQQAIKRGKELNPQAEVAIAWGSPRTRSKETSVLVMLANENIDPDLGLPEIEKAINKEINTGGKDKRKIIEDSRLDFNFRGKGIGKWLSELYGGDKPFLLTYIKESDKRALETRDKDSDTYTRKAADIAEIVLRYIKIASTFNRIVSKSDKYKTKGNQLERYLGTHGTVVESFIAKVLEKLNGVEARDNFAKALGNEFKEIKGIRVEIVNNGGDDQVIFVEFEADGVQQSVNIDVKLLKEILEDRKKFEEKFEEK